MQEIRRDLVFLLNQPSYIARMAIRHSHRLSGYHNLQFRSGIHGDLPMIEDKDDAGKRLNR
jgi:hypothetical protein